MIFISKIEQSDSLSESSYDSQIQKIFATKLKTRKRKLQRERWNNAYLIPLAINENSFKMEYRMTHYAFLYLHSLLKNDLTVNEIMATISNCESNSTNITTESRLGCFLILLGGGRVAECMRTHGVSKDFVYKNFKRILNIIINHPLLKISCSNDIIALKERLFYI